MQALIFIFQNVFYFFAVLFLLRFFMQAFRVSFLTPIGQFILKLTQFWVVPLRKMVPSFFNLDWASLLGALTMVLIFYVVRLFLQNTVILNWQAFLGIFALMVLIALLRLILNVFIFSILLFAIMSWVNPMHPIMQTLCAFVRPILKPIQRIVPVISGIDLSPVVALLVLQALLLFLPNA